MATVNYYAAAHLDRAGDRRKDPRWIETRLSHESSRFIVLWRDQQLLIKDAGNIRPALLDASALHRVFDAAPQIVFLGLDREDRAVFSVELSPNAEPLAAVSLPREFENGLMFEGLRATGGWLASGDAALLAYARGMANWHGRHRFCGVCGAPARSSEGGHVRVCTNVDCAAQHFPRTDPAVIMLVTDGDRCLLGRQKIWPPGMHSTLAGFVEPGESLEAAVAREVKEESGISVERVVYQSSQPWPFPASIMLGFRAQAVTTEILVDPSELESADWYHRDWLRSHRGDETFCLPPKESIARRLINDWIVSG